MKYILAIVAMLYAFLSVFAAAVQLKTVEQKGTPCLMVFGGILLTGAVILLFFAASWDWILALVGCAGISIAAFLNGKRSGNLHTSHHIIRLMIAFILVAGFLFL